MSSQETCFAIISIHVVFKLASFDTFDYVFVIRCLVFILG